MARSLAVVPACSGDAEAFSPGAVGVAAVSARTTSGAASAASMAETAISELFIAHSTEIEN
jgi:hypothetical protein